MLSPNTMSDILKGGSEDDLTNASRHLVSTLVPSVAQAVKFSHEFPTHSTPAFTYYNDYAEYKAVMNGNCNHILSTVQSIIDELHGNANIMDQPQPKSLEEKFNTLVSINDGVLDRITAEMDREEFPDKGNNSNVQNFVVTLDDGQTSISLHENNYSSNGFKVNKRPWDAIGRNPTRLFASKHIVRPQNFFTVPPDNSHAPFLPILKSKPNAIVELQDCNFEADPETFDYVHPYLSELEDLKGNWEDYKYIPIAANPKPSSLEETPLDIVDNVDMLNNMLKELSGASEVAVDLEHHSYRSFLGITCLIQLSTRAKDYIVDALALRDHLGRLNELFTDPKVVKVLHGSDLDLMWLQRDFGVYIVNLFDTGQAARTLQFPRFSLAYLLQRFVGIFPNKAFQLADWRIRPLPRELIDYARSDTHYLLYVAEHLRGLLASQNLLNEALERSRRLCLRIYKKPRFNNLEYLFKPHADSNMSLNKRQLYALKHLCILRDSIARNEDESRAFVLPNHLIHQIAEKLPKETTGMFACCNPVPPLLRKYVADFHKIILEARNGKNIEQEIDQDRVTLESVNLPNLTSNVIPLYSTASRSAPHDVRSVGHHILTNSSPNSLKRSPLTKPSLFGRRFPHYQKPVLGVFMDPSRFVLQKLLDVVKPMQVSDHTSVENESHLVSNDSSGPTATTLGINEDPLFKPPLPESVQILDGKVASPIKLTAAEAIEVEDLGAKFRPRSVCLGRSAQSRALANLKNRQQQQKPGTEYPSQLNVTTGQSRSPSSKELDNASTDTDVVILRDQKLKKLPKATKSQTHQSLSGGLTIDLVNDPPSHSIVEPSQSPSKPLARLEIPMTPEIQAAIHQVPGSSGRRKRRSRGGGRGGGSGVGNTTSLRGSVPFSRSGCAVFTPPQLQRKRNN